ncbi:MAG: glutamate synthase subunit beta [Eubacteriales bacterium]
MGKPTGFLEFERKGNISIKPEERITNFNEFHAPLEEEERRVQAARCMDCGVPFCGSAINLKGMVTGCPLHNLIPEWNDGIYKGDFEFALSRLTKTASFPEFTGRVCPALCEKACTCAMDGDAVSIRDNEVFLIEKGFAEGYVKPRIPELRSDKKVAVIGSGPSGLAVADALNRRGHNVTVYERDDRVGGLLMYGIPNMKLEKHIIDRRVTLMEEEGVTFITNANFGKNLSQKEVIDAFDAVILCCGAKEARDLTVENREAEGIYFAVDFLTQTTKSLLDSQLKNEKFISAKGKDVIVVGGGDTGNDCVGTSIRHGANSVVQIEMMPKPPEERLATNPWPEWPLVLKTDYGQEEAKAVFGEDPRVYNTTIKSVTVVEGKITNVETVQVKFIEGTLNFVEGSEKNYPADLILIAAGFTGAEQYTTEGLNIEYSPRNTVITKENTYQTGEEKVFACGDMRRGQSLVVWSIAEGKACAKEVDEFLMGYSYL